MTLVKKHVTSRYLAANRGNSKKSTGPRSAPGKRRVAHNAGKHFFYTQITPSRMQAIGEDPHEFARLHQSLRSAVGPRDGYEEMLVEEMAVNRWRLGRLRRAEMGKLWHERMMLEARRYPSLDRAPGAENIVLDSFGLVAAPDSPHKFLEIVHMLMSVRDKVLSEGFTPQGLELLKAVYGESPAVPGFGLLTNFRAQMPSRLLKPPDEDEEDADHDNEDDDGAGDEGDNGGDDAAGSEVAGEEGDGDEESESGTAVEGRVEGEPASPATPEGEPAPPGQLPVEAREAEGLADEQEDPKVEAMGSFIESLEREIESYARAGKDDAMARMAPTPQPLRDICLIPAKEDIEPILRYETTLQREFERLQKQLRDWRESNSEARPGRPRERRD